MDALTEVDFKYTVRSAVDADRRFIVETTARVRQPHGVNWADWECYGRTWASETLGDGGIGSTQVVESDGVILGFLMPGYKDGAPVYVECLYVKRDFRGLGFGRVLLDAAGFDDKVPCRAPTDSMRMWAKGRGITLVVVD